MPVLYAGADLGCALGETVFHDLPDDPTVPAEVFRADLLTIRAGAVGVDADVDLADLTDAALTSYGYRRDEVIDTPRQEYPVTRRWGQHAWDTTACAGLVWNSRRSPEQLSFMLFVDPPLPTDRPRGLSRRRHLVVMSPPVPLYDGEGLAQVMVEGARRNVTIIV